MDSRYRIDDSTRIITPALIVFREILIENIEKMIAVAGDVKRLRPHCKTHKMREVTRLEVERGILKHKAATFAEAEMVATAGARDVFLAYNLVGPNIARAVGFRKTFPEITFSVTADDARMIALLGTAMSAAGTTIDVVLDVDTGQHRTGVPVGETARELYALIAKTPGLVPGGLHLYDGQNHQTSVAERTVAVDACWNAVAGLRDELVAAGMAVPRIIAGGTGSFPVFAKKSDAALELSPGTCVFNDAGYGEMFPDLKFTPAAVVLTRVISRPTENRVTLDLGYKAVASDPPAGRRVTLPSIPDAELVLQNEEHLVVQTASAANFAPGDELFAIPRHICPTSALHKQAYVVEGGRVVDEWQVVGRDRWLTI